MLDPDDRQLYIDALRPPQDYELDCSIATTYTLNLLTLLAVPLSFARFGRKTKERILEDPISILEALRRTAGKFHVFCQNGAIKIPPSPNPLFQYLEEMIIEVSPPYSEGVFHPKIWVLRFVNESGRKVFYRFLCLSRNITFDKSWDTILTLEGEVRKRFFARNRPLADFVQMLPKMAKKAVRKSVRLDIVKIAEEIRHVDFMLPWPYEDLRFWPMGIGVYKSFPVRKDYSRLVVISPFLTDRLLQRLALKKSKNILISRNDELDLIKPETRDLFEKYVLDEVAGEEEETSIEISSEAAKESPLDVQSDLTGLHAKLYLAEVGWEAYLWSGSANATNAAFDNINVEFLVQLKGKKSRVGIDNFLAQKEGTTAFVDILREYIPPDKPVVEKEAEKEIERRLEKLCRRIANSDFRARVVPSGKKNHYDLELLWPQGLRVKEEGDVEAKVWPVSLKSSAAVRIDLAHPGLTAKFHLLSIDRITAFFAFRLELGKISKGFVLNLPIRGVPAKRQSQLLQAIVSNRESFLRYLWILLYEGDFAFLPSNAEEKSGGLFPTKGSFRLGEEMPLFEELVRTYSRSPQKIKRIAQFVEEIARSEGGQRILPGEFKLLWETIREARLG